jgi:isoquinoline 1-oxidoreductase beta subunit
MNATARWDTRAPRSLTPTKWLPWRPALKPPAAAKPVRCLQKCTWRRFCRRGATDYVFQVVAIAKETPGLPVKMIWSREDMLHGAFYPITQCKMTAGLTLRATSPVCMMRISGQSILANGSPKTSSMAKTQAL